MNILLRIDSALARLEQALAVALFAGLALLTFGSIVVRNFFGVSSQTALELAPVAVLWITLVGASLALKQGRHIRLEILLRSAPGPVRRIARTATGLFGAAVMAGLFLSSFGFVKNEVAIFGGRGWLSVIFPFFFAVCTFRYLIGVLERSGDSSGGSEA